MMLFRPFFATLFLALLLCPPTVVAQQTFDVVLRGGTVYDGSGRPPYSADVAILNDRVAAIGDGAEWKSKRSIDVTGQAVAPGFINVLSWSTRSLLHDGRGESDLRQGVTLEVFGEGWSMGPLSNRMQRELLQDQGDIKYKVPWRSLSGYLKHMTEQGVTMNVASFVGATTIRIHVIGYQDRKPTASELVRMKQLVRDEMENGALGIGSSLIYAPAFYAETDELIELCKAAAEFGGMYITHMRSEGNRLEEAVDEALRIGKEAGIPVEIYHLKAAGEANWDKLDAVISKVETARAEGFGVTADMYTYTAGATGLNAAMPPWVQEGGFRRWSERLQDPDVRERVLKEMKTPTDEWENLMLMAGSPDKVLLVGFKSPRLKHLTGKSLAEVAKQRGKSPEETAMDLVVEDGSRVETVYFLMSPENVRRKIALPWVSFGSDAAAMSPQGAFLNSNPHPRAYGCFARLLGRFVREQEIISLEEAIRKMTSLPAFNLGLRGRGRLEAGYFADIVVFDPKTIADKATFSAPHALSVGVRHVFVNGVAALLNGELTDARPGRALKGPGARRAAVNRKKPVVISDQARRIHSASFVFDGHNDLPWALRRRASSSFEKLDIAKPHPEMHTDIPRLKKGNVGAQFWSVYVPASTSAKGESLLQTLEQIELVHAMMKRYPETFAFARTASDIDKARQAGKIASLIGVEGGHAIENSIANLRRLHKLGAKYMTLTHSDTLAWADSATDEAKHGGLTKFGEEVVREMNRLGMLVDLSHVSPETMKDALRISKSPIIFSHSSARAVADHPRNVPDDVLRLTAKNGGVVMVNFFSGFVVPESAKRMQKLFDVSRELRKKYPNEEDHRKAFQNWRRKNPIDPGTIHDLVDHIDHIVRVAGVDHVGIGSDFDGVSVLPKQLEDVATYPLITQALLDRGYTEKEVGKVMSGNIMRVIREADRLAEKP